MSNPQIVWLRRDLRMKDQPALHAAAEAGPVVPVYVLDDDRPKQSGSDRCFGGAHRWWLHHSLESLGKSFGARNGSIVLRRGDSVSVLASIADEIGAEAVHANRHYEPWWREAEEELKDALPDGCELVLHDGNYLMPPGTATTGSGDPYKIYTPFSKAMLDLFPPRDELPEPDTISQPSDMPDSDDLSDWDLLPTKPDWAAGFREFWKVGEDAAHDRLEWWADEVAAYDESRNLPSKDETSQMSPHLHWGEISPVTIWHRLKDKRSGGWKTYEKELIWRDYAQNIIMQFPKYPDQSYRDYDEQVLWRHPNRGHLIQEELEAWQQGRTGYPIVDAGMRQLWKTGWMHNRVRMIAASFLIKHLLIDWRHGERWYWDCLVDGDYASNGTNWQWVAGTGVDSNMFPRIMAPLSQSEKFDAADYIRQYVPELSDLSDEDIHDPPEGKRPDDYPEKIIGHKEARERALQAYRDSKGE
ncbi:cryptochrome/photolyase family protein [Qipengyuania atrilutea]|uniref:Deoxyribodipyrimidine photo-lyase n=1 Tax=Qipengyuania atrilutea TaxID=2744473 RepID=A0A850H1Y9_9SPHN|nr:deoxyribodipyrimidine photo-lyase [Actirhodobacter atriluteus]NVD43943.1 deoxyribodipyrimidine photo-lyase [Actirhodobacter atriluteus]